MTTDTQDGDHPESSDHASAASDDQHLEQLAARFLALWREQVAATADGADAASAIGRLYASLGADTTRMGEGFEAWGKLIGQMAMGQQAAPQNANPLCDGQWQPIYGQMAKAARDLPAGPFPAAMPFPPNMAAMAGMTGMGTGGDKPPTSPADQTADQTAGAPSPASSLKNTSATKNTARGQGKNDQSTETKAASAKKAKPEAGGAKAAADAHGSRDDELAQLARRIADLSETIAALEAGTEGTGGKPPSGD